MKQRLFLIIISTYFMLILFSCKTTSNNGGERLDPNMAVDGDNTISAACIDDSNAGLGGGADGDCIHKNLNPIGIAVDESYHSYYGNLINGDNATAFQAWIKDTDNRENRNIYNLINVLKIDRDYLEALNSLQSSCYYYFDYNTDILYGGDIAAADNYYSTAIERVDEYMIKYYLLKFKGELNNFIKNDSRYNEWLDIKKSADDWYYCKYNGNEIYGVDGIFSGDFRQWSIAEAVEYFNIEQSVLEDIAAIANQAALYSCSINIAALYDSEAVNAVKDSIKADKDDGFSVDPALLDTKFITFDLTKLEESWAYIQNSGEFIAN